MKNNELLIVVSPHNWYDHILKNKNNRPLKLVEYVKKTGNFGFVMVVNRINPKRILRSKGKEDRNTIVRGTFFKLLFDECQEIYYLEHFLPFGFWEQSFLPKLIEKCSAFLGANQEYLWVFDPKSTYMFNKRYNLNIFDAYDDWAISPLFENNKKHMKYILLGYETAKRNADIVFVNTTYMKQKYFNNKNNVFLLPNTSSLVINNNKTHKQNFGDNKTIGYVGHIHSRIDLDILEKLLKNFSDYNIVFLGENHLDSDVFNRLISEYRNLKLLGSVSYDHLSSYISAFDVAIVPHLVNNYTLSQDSMKIYDYLSCGSAIVTTDIPPTDILPNDEGFIYRAKSAEEFVDKVRIAVNNNNEELKHRRMNYMVQNTWKNRAEYICKIIDEVKHD
ncbi:glycosyltransferase [Robertmurraya korlensis]|uniref:glycosyltransferase n=1 Tax=Robertmurraya korlensis TaxID=519977 RepID=UPI002042544F|nr:glycosyltransferase [Robertmurraya korlensis]MCM3602225.1 glycosyltransferase [Robertmurraya korlensis]